MFIKVLRAKIHRATVTEANVEYDGSIAIDMDLTDAVGIAPGQFVLIADMANGQRFETYVIAAPRGSGTICVNGAAAKLVDVGDQIIIMASAQVSPEEAASLKPAVVVLDEKNRISDGP